MNNQTRQMTNYIIPLAVSPGLGGTSKPCGGSCSMPTPKARKKPLTRQRIDFDFIDPKQADIADEYIHEIFERYDEVLPPLPSAQSTTPPRAPPVLEGWRTPEKIESMVPKAKTPSPSPKYVMPQVKLHQWFDQAPPGQLEQSVLVETPPCSPASPPPISPRSMPPRRTPTPPRPSPPASPRRSPFQSPCPVSPFAAETGDVEQMFIAAGISPAKLPPPSPPSPYSTEEEMRLMMDMVKMAAGRQGIVRQPEWFGPRADFKPMPRITETTTQPGMGRMGLPEVVQVDLETVGTGQPVEAPYVRTPYVPPQRASPVSEESYVSEEEVICTPPCSPIRPEEVQGVVPTSPLPQFQQAVPSPPRRSPVLPATGAFDVLEQTAFSFEEFDRTPPVMYQVTPKPSPYLSPYGTPPGRPMLSPPLPIPGPDATFLSQEYQSPYASPQSPRYASPQWSVSGGESSVEDEDEMGLPSLVQLYGQHMPGVTGSPQGGAIPPTRRVITWEDQLPAVAGPCGVCVGEEIQVDDLPLPEEQVDVDIPLAPLEPFVEKSAVPEPRYDFSPVMPHYEGITLDQEAIDMDALYAGDYGEYEVFEAEPPPAQRLPSPPQSPRSPPCAEKRWDELMDETRHAGQFDVSVELAGSPGPGSPYASPVGLQGMPPQVSPARPPRMTPPRVPPSPRMSPPRAAPSPQRSPPRVSPLAVQTRSPMTMPQSPVRIPSPAAAAARPPSPRTPPGSPIAIPDLSPFRMPQPSPPCGPCDRPSEMPSAIAGAGRRSPQRVVKQTMTQKRIVTVLPPQPTVELEFEGEIVRPFAGADISAGSESQDEDTDFRWMD